MKEVFKNNYNYYPQEKRKRENFASIEVKHSATKGELREQKEPVEIKKTSLPMLFNNKSMAVRESQENLSEQRAKKDMEKKKSKN